LEIFFRNFGLRASVTIPLEKIADYQLVARRFPMLIVVPLLVAVASYGLIYLVFHQSIVPRELATWPIVIFATSIVALIRGLPRLELFVFFDYWKKPIFYIVREAREAEACNAFVAALLERVEAVGTDSGDGTATPPQPTPAAAASPAESSSGVPSQRQYCWLVAVVAGALSAGFPPAVQSLPAFDGLILPVVILSSLASLLCGTFAFVAQERLRYWSILGMALAMVAPLFY